jgi:hypothetical protein
MIAGIKKRVYPHLFRGSSATHLLMGGMSVPEIQSQTKHRSMETLVKHYINPSKEKVKKDYTEIFDKYNYEETPIPQPETKQPEVTQSTTKPKLKPKQDDTDKTDRYISLLNEGKISEDTFVKLMTFNNKDNSLVGYS